MAGIAGRLRWLSVGIVTGLALAACDAEPPTAGSRRAELPFLQERYASIATCTPYCQGALSGCSPSCSGPECAQQLAAGAPDSRTVKLGSEDCQVLDVVFNGGTVVPRRAISDLVVHVAGLDSGARVRVEASRLGRDFEVVAWINGQPQQTNARCSARHEGSRILLDLSAGQLDSGCNYVETVSHMRFSVDGANLVGTQIEIDAVEVEPCSFRLSGAASTDSCANTITNPLPRPTADQTTGGP